MIWLLLNPFSSDAIEEEKCSTRWLDDGQMVVLTFELIHPSAFWRNSSVFREIELKREAAGWNERLGEFNVFPWKMPLSRIYENHNSVSLSSSEAELLSETLS